MKRFGLFLLLLVSVFTLSACEKLTDIEKAEKDIVELLDAYSNSLQGAVKFESGTEDDLLVSELKYIFKVEDEEKVIDQLMVTQVEGEEEWSLYIKDKVGYIHNEGEKIKENLTDNDLKVKVEEFGFNAFIEPIAKIFDEEFFKAATVKVEKSKTTLELDLEKYEGTVINQSGEITKFEVVLHYDEKTITKIENNVTRNDVVHVIRVTFGGTKDIQISFPDFSQYK